MEEKRERALEERICRYCKYWDRNCSSRPGTFGCCISLLANYGVPCDWARRNYEFFETIRFHTCKFWEQRENEN